MIFECTNCGSQFNLDEENFSSHIVSCPNCREVFEFLKDGSHEAAIELFHKKLRAAEHHPRYEIIEEIGRGRISVVFKALDTLLNRLVVLKYIYPVYARNEFFKFCILKERQILSDLDHPGILTIYDAFDCESALVSVLEFIDV